MRLDYQLLLKSPPLDLLSGSAPADSVRPVFLCCVNRSMRESVAMLLQVWKIHCWCETECDQCARVNSLVKLVSCRCCDRKARAAHKAFHTVAASSNRDHMPWSLYYCLFAPDIYGCYSSRTSRSWWIAHSTQRQGRGCSTGFSHSIKLRGSLEYVYKRLVGMRLDQ